MDDDEVRLPPILLPGYGERRLARAILVLAGYGVATFWLLIAAMPSPMGMVSSEPSPFPITTLVAFGMQLVGLAWMIRVYRSATNPEPDHANWRSHDR